MKWFNQPSQIPSLKGSPPNARLVKILSDISLDKPVSSNELEEVLLLSQNPGNLPPFAALTLAPACIELLTGSSTHPRHEISSDYGLLCIDVLVVCIQVAILGELEVLYEYVETEKARTNRQNPGVRLNRYVVSVLHDQVIACNDPGGSNAKFPKLFGVSTENAVDFSSYLFVERGPFLASRLIRGEKWDGWLVLFYMLWVRSESGSVSEEVGLLFHEMICRFGVVKLGSSDAESLLGWMTARLKHALMKHNVIRTTSLFVDDMDKQQVGQAYTRRIASSFPLLSPSLCLFNWAVLSLNIGQPYLVMTFFKAAYLRLWAALDPMKETWPLGLVQIMNLLEYIDHLMGYTRALIQGEGPEEPSNTLKVSLGGLAWQNDIISLLARALVAHLQDHQNEHIIKFLLGMLSNVEDSMAVIFAHCPPSSEISNNAYTDWLKGAKLFRELLWAPNRTKPSRVYLTKCHKKWMKLGSLIFVDRMTDGQEACSNPRCPYPCPVSSGDDHLVCGRCFLGVYCSYACQHAHSLYRRPDDLPLHTCIPPDILPVLANEGSIVVPYSYKP